MDVSLEFCALFIKPEQWFFRDRCNKVSLKIYDESVSDAETLHLNDALDTWAVKDALLNLAGTAEAQEGVELNQRIDALFDRLAKQWTAEGRWPLGNGSDSLRNKMKKNLQNTGWMQGNRCWVKL